MMLMTMSSSISVNAERREDRTYFIGNIGGETAVGVSAALRLSSTASCYQKKRVHATFRDGSGALLL